uniref:Uncharacterized protein n=1 Tax=Arion vulgaris TaxID=1028688 RepID=A0A0B7B3E7_9EUPU
MDFLTALEEAKQQGITNDDFVRIWEQEMKLKQQKEESRALELKLAVGKIQESAQSQSTKDQMKSILQNHLKDVQQQIAELRNDLIQQSNSQFQKIYNQFDSQAAVTAMVIKNELELVLAQHNANAHAYLGNVNYSYDDFQQPLPEDCYHPSSHDFEQTKQNQKPAKARIHSHLGSVPENQDEHIFPVDDGAILCVRDIDQLITDAIVTESSVYILPDCPGKVRLSIWFGGTNNINARITISGIKQQFLKKPRIFTITGHIENKNSGSYSPLFEGISVKKLRPKREMQVNTSICLKTGKGSYDNVTYEDLVKRNFVINNSLVIKWFVTSEESQGDAA